MAGPPDMGLAQTRDTRWLALSDHAGPLGATDLPDLLPRGTLVLDLIQPKSGPSVLLDYRATTTTNPRVLSIFYDPTTGISMLHRQDATVQRHHLPGPLPQNGAPARLTYCWDTAAVTWTLLLEDTAATWARTSHGTHPIPLATADLLAMCAGPAAARRDAAVQWFGVCENTPATPPAAWIGQRSPVQTPRGPVAAADLRLGDLVQTLDHGPQPILAMQMQALPNRGRLAPVLLRAPYFASHVDLLVSQAQLTLLSGAGVEYLFGEDAVLAPAAALRDGNTALSDTRRPMTAIVALDLGKPALIIADGCPLLCSANSATALPYRLLHDYEVLPLQSLLGRGGQRSAA